MTDFEIIKKYPRVFGEPPFDMKQTLIGFGFEVGDGWLPLLEKLSDEIDKILERDNIQDFRVVQVKEKFGSLCYYTRGTSNEEIRNLISEAEDEARKTCELCGEPAKINAERYSYAIRCEVHSK